MKEVFRQVAAQLDRETVAKMLAWAALATGTVLLVSDAKHDSRSASVPAVSQHAVDLGMHRTFGAEKYGIMVDSRAGRGVDCWPGSQKVVVGSPTHTRVDGVKATIPFDSVDGDGLYGGISKGLSYADTAYGIQQGWTLRYHNGDYRLYHFTTGDYRSIATTWGKEAVAEVTGQEIESLDWAQLEVRGPHSYTDGSTTVTLSTTQGLTSPYFESYVELDVQCADYLPYDRIEA